MRKFAGVLLFLHHDGTLGHLDQAGETEQDEKEGYERCGQDQHQFASKTVKKLACQKSTDNLDAANDVAPKLGIVLLAHLVEDINMLDWITLIHEFLV